MKTQTFDQFTRLFAHRISRRAVLATAVGVAASQLSRGSAGAASDDASALVLSYYQLVDAYRYDEAYALLGSKWQSQQSLDTFTSGYGNTAFVQCQVTSATPADGMETVRVRLISWHNDGGIAAYMGMYTVGAEGGQLRIIAGSNTAIDPPAGTQPLCAADQLSFKFVPWDAGAGNRTSAVVGTNVGSEACVAGGSPRVEITNGSHTVRSDSQTSSPPIGILLEPGATAQAPLRFADWCEPTSGKSTVTVELPGDPNTVALHPGSAGISFPPCLGAGQSALLEVSGWTSAS